MAGIDPAELARLDAAITTQLNILRHSSNVEAKVLRLLEQMRKELVVKLANIDLTNWGKARLNQLLRDTTATIAEYYTQAQSVVSPSYAVVTGITAQQTVAGIGASLPSKAVLDAVVSNVLVEGTPLAQWWDKMTADSVFRFSAAIRQGIAQGETQVEIGKRVKDIADIAARNAKSVVHTSIMAVMNDARMATIDGNAEEGTRMEYLATLDSHTCLVCAPRDGLRWYVKSKEPIGHNLDWKPPPLHVNCRCTVSELTMLSDFIEGGRASSSGVVSGKTTFKDYLARQTPAFQDEVLGKGRADMYRAGKITLMDVVSGNGSPLTLDELQRKYK